MRNPATGRPAVAAGAVALVLAASVAAADAATNDATCRVTSYFSDANLTTYVGSASTCPGTSRQAGRASAFVEVDVIETRKSSQQAISRGDFLCELEANCAIDASASTTLAVQPAGKNQGLRPIFVRGRMQPTSARQ